MDAITQQVIDRLAALYPQHSVRLTHQFLDGTEGRACGVVPVDWNGQAIQVEGQWWK